MIHRHGLLRDGYGDADGQIHEWKGYYNCYHGQNVRMAMEIARHGYCHAETFQPVDEDDAEGSENGHHGGREAAGLVGNDAKRAGGW